jgi:hypothetical protein
MKTQHTPGPWVTMPTNDGFAIKEKELLERGFSDRIAEINHYPKETAQANARLIAAAPELLEALEYVVKWHRDNDSGVGELYGRDYITTAIQAIRHAKG